MPREYRPRSESPTDPSRSRTYTDSFNASEAGKGRTGVVRTVEELASRSEPEPQSGTTQREVFDTFNRFSLSETLEEDNNNTPEHKLRGGGRVDRLQTEAKVNCRGEKPSEEKSTGGSKEKGVSKNSESQRSFYWGSEEEESEKEPEATRSPTEVPEERGRPRRLQKRASSKTLETSTMSSRSDFNKPRPENYAKTDQLFDTSSDATAYNVPIPAIPSTQKESQTASSSFFNRLRSLSRPRGRSKSRSRKTED